jgi:hypothetical protein
MMLSKSWMLGLSEDVVSRSWINSLKAVQLLLAYGKIDVLEVGVGVEKLTLRLLQHRNVLVLFMRQAFHESIHVETINLSTVLLLSRRSIQVLPICKEQACEASYKRCSYSIGMERRRTDQ